MGKKLVRHHRKPKSHGGGGGDNISLVTKTRHQAWHTLFGSMSPHQICRAINKWWLDKDWCFVCVRRNDIEKVDR